MKYHILKGRNFDEQSVNQYLSLHHRNKEFEVWKFKPNLIHPFPFYNEASNRTIHKLGAKSLGRFNVKGLIRKLYQTKNGEFIVYRYKKDQLSGTSFRN